ncbi:MAG: hypothetical protein ACJ72X_10060 [Nitrososphaeraceae archaeon]
MTMLLLSSDTDLYSYMPTDEMNFNDIYRDIVANSLFTERQMYIISRHLIDRNGVRSISRGAYYRQIKQCRHKITSILYSILLLQSVGAIDNKTLSVLQTLADRLSVIFRKEESDITDIRRTESVIFALKTTLNKMCNV